MFPSSTGNMLHFLGGRIDRSCGFRGGHANGLEWNECVCEIKSIRNASMEGVRVQCCGQGFF